MNAVKWGIIGPGNIANNFADGLKESNKGNLVAIASKNDERRNNFGNKYNIDKSMRFSNYEEIINSSNVDAIYISTPHTLHAEWTMKAAKKGKHILCEKPAAVNFKEGKRIIETVRGAGVFFMEGFMYRCHPQIFSLLNLIKANKIGEIKHIESSFGFDTGKTIPESRLFRTNLAGGAILDVGLYPVSLSRLIAGTAMGKKFVDPVSLRGEAKIGETQVDEIAHARMEFENGITANVSAAIRQEMKNNTVITGTKGTIEIEQPWTPGREGGPYHTIFKIIIDDKKDTVNFRGPEHLFFFEADLASKSILKNITEAPHPGMTWEDTLGNLMTLDKWRNNIGYFLPQDS